MSEKMKNKPKEHDMDYTKELEKLHDLKEKNIISEDEYNDQYEKEETINKVKPFSTDWDDDSYSVW